jgi:hypothetical protein
MEPKGPNRNFMKKILNNDRKIVGQIFMTASMEVLKKDFGFSPDQIDEFRKNVQAEINRMQ